MRLSKRDAGRHCTVKYTDSGRMDGILLYVDRENRGAAVYLFADQTLDQSVDFSQVVELRDYVEPK
jgi:hypothetical protein